MQAKPNNKLLPLVWTNVFELRNFGYGNNTSFNFRGTITWEKPCNSIFVDFISGDNPTSSSTTYGRRPSTIYRLVPGWTGTMYPLYEGIDSSQQKQVSEVTTTSITLTGGSHTGLGLIARIIDGDKATLIKSCTDAESNAIGNGSVALLEMDLSKYRYIIASHKRNPNETAAYALYTILEVNNSIQVIRGTDSNSSSGKYVRVAEEGIYYSSASGTCPVNIYGYK